MSELALQLIAENKRTKDPVLDLGKCGLKEIPKELFDCVWLEELVLSNEWLDDSQNEKYTMSKNKGEVNYLSAISPEIGKLKKLKILKAGGDPIIYWKISDITFLQSLKGLQSLDLNYNEISDISILKSLTGLQSLNLSMNLISDISILQSLTNLQSLDLYNNQVSDISFLQSLKGLKHLILSRNQISEIDFLQSLKSLRSLQINVSQISNISFLQSLSGLKYLGLNSNRIQDTGFLQSLTNLKSLGLCNNQISDICFLQLLTNLQSLDLDNNRISDISILQSLINLQSLNLRENQISDISFLQSLANLQSLDLYNNQISDISFLQSLTRLKSLNLGENQISDISCLKSLMSLQSLYLANNQIRYLDENWLSHFNDISRLCLTGNPIRNIKKEIIDQYDCLFSLKEYFKDLEQGTVAEYEAKIILTGNGRVGKTCIVKRWLQDQFNENEETTHSIIIKGENFPEKASKNKLKNLRLNIWDFGGQDIYHATHRYFMQTNALFLLVWDAETEKLKTQTEVFEKTGKKVEYKNHPIRDWLSFIKTQGKSSPVIIVQTKRDKFPGDAPVFTANEKKDFNIKAILSVESSSTEADNGFDMMKSAIFQTVAEELKKNNAPLPAQWFDIKEKIWQVQGENQAKEESEKKRQMTLNEFADLCREEGLDTRGAAVLLEYFHNCGLFYYKKGLFENSIVLDQPWAINAVYRIFNRADFFAELHPNGKFTGEDLNRVWSMPDKEGCIYNIKEQELFVSFMKQCEICFELTNEYETSYFKRTFIAPQLLPAEKPDTIAHRNLFKDKPVYFKYKHQFLHKAVMQRFIVRCGRFAEEADMWQQGLILEWEGEPALIEAFPETNEILIETKNIINKNLLEKIRNEIKEITEEESGIEEFVSFDNVTHINLEKLRNIPAGNEKIQPENGQWVLVSPYLPLLHLNEKNTFEKDINGIQQNPVLTDSKNKKIKIFISYAHVDEKTRKTFEEIYLKAIQNNYGKNLEVWSDTKLKPGTSWGPKIKKEIEEADMIVFFLSNGFVASNYINETEIKIAVERYKQKQQIIVPVYIEEIPEELLPFSDKQYLPGGKPLKDWKPQNKGWVKISDGLLSIIDDINNGSTSEYFE